MPTIYLLGDSTVEDNKPPFRGWGWALREWTAPGVAVSNHAMSGRSTRSFLAEGRFEPVKAAMQPGDLLMIQFGHNDEKDEDDLHTDPDGLFYDNLKFFCDAAAACGAQPVLITPVCRRYFVTPKSLLYTHGEYPAAIRRLAQAESIPLCDLKLLSRRLYLELGQEKTAELFVRLAPGKHPDFPDGHDDKTHFNADGAAVIARLVAAWLGQDKRFSSYVLPA